VTQLRRILISGYYGFSNAGDEAVLSAIIGGLRSQAGDDVEITVLSASPEETANAHEVTAVPRGSASHVTKALKGCDLLISGGGSLIQDATSFRSLAYYLAIIALAKFYRRKVMILGQGIGPLRRSISRRLTQAVLNKVDLITVRDARSAALLEELGVRKPPIRTTADPTLLLEPCQSEEAIRLLSDMGLSAHDDLIAVSLRKWPILRIEESATEALAALAKTLPAKLLLLTMHTPEDVLIARQVQEALDLPGRVIVQPEPWTGGQLLGVLAKCRLAVAMRLHALIFAAAAGVPSIGIVYDPKVEHFLAATGQQSISLAEAASGLLAERVTRAWEARDALASRLSETVPAMREAAAENIRLALQVLGS